MEFKFTAEEQFHILRHYTKVDEQYIQKLLQVSEFSKEDIYNQLKIFGSKFHYHFTTNPEHLNKIINQRISHGNHSLKQFGTRTIYTFQYTSNEYHDGIGYCNIVSIEELSSEHREKIIEVPRGDEMIRTITDIKPKPTWEFHMVVINDNESLVSTVFPGTYAPPFPNRKNQSELEYQNNVQFWNEYVLIT